MASLELSNEVEASQTEEMNFQETRAKTKHYTLLLSITYLCLFVGSVASTLVLKFYFIHKGSSLWISTWVQSAGFPILLLPVYLPFYVLKTTERQPFKGFTLKIMLLSISVGAFLGVNNILFSLGSWYLPVSTASLVLSSQLVFNLILSVLIVKQKITFTNLNCVILLTLSSVILALGSNHDRPMGLTHKQYLLGFFATLGAGLMFALYLPVMEMVYRKIYCYAMVVEMQLVMEVAATVVASIGMAAGGGFSDLKMESGSFDRGVAVYWMTIVGNLLAWQMCFMGTAGLVFLTTSLTGGVSMTALMGINVLGGVVVYGDEFSGLKAVSTVLCFWGFGSYLYGMYRKKNKSKLEQRGDDIPYSYSSRVRDLLRHASCSCTKSRVEEPQGQVDVKIVPA